MIIRISAFIIMAISFLILFYKNDSDNYMAGYPVTNNSMADVDIC